MAVTEGEAPNLPNTSQRTGVHAEARIHNMEHPKEALQWVLFPFGHRGRATAIERIISFSSNCEVYFGNKYPYRLIE